MSVTSRIRVVGAVASSIAVVLAVLVLFGVWATAGALPGILSIGPAGALMGMFVTTTVCVALALSLDGSEQRLALNPEPTQPLQPQTSYRFPPA